MSQLSGSGFISRVGLGFLSSQSTGFLEITQPLIQWVSGNKTAAARSWPLILIQCHC